MKIVTGYKGEAHITSNEIQGENQGTYGADSYVLSVGSQFAPTLISANEMQIADGEGVLQGVHFRVDPGTYDSVTIENGAQGMKRKDLVVCRYTKDAETGIEQTEWVVIKGTATSGTATRPSATSGDILNGATVADMAMFEVVLSGINVTAVNPLFSVLKSMQELQALIATNAAGISALNTNAITSPGTLIGATANLNTYTTPGRYYAVSTTNISNLPVAGSSTMPVDLIVIPRGTVGRVYQIAFIYSSSAPFVYVRTMTGASSWSAWKEMT